MEQRDEMTASELQANMERLAGERIERIRRVDQGRLNEMLRPELECCCYEERSLILRFPVQTWELNQRNVMHGGIISAAFDVTMGFLTFALVEGERFCPTANLSVAFLRPVICGSDLLVRAEGNFSGRKLVALTARAWQTEERKPAATASAQFAVGEKKK